MNTVHLVIPDAALRAAIVEQLSLANLAAEECADIPAALAANTATLLLIDETALDKKALAALDTAKNKNAVRLLLGNAPTESAADPITESFAKPLRLGHLLARLKFYLETAPRLRSTPLTFGTFRLEPQNRCIISVDTNTTIRLTEKETALLEYLGQSEKPITRDELLTAIWGYDARIDTHTLETHIYRLRRKLNPNGEGPDYLINENGAYRLSAGKI
jgi:DNA-binding response OmpR family regulator